MDKERAEAILISDFNLDILKGYLNNDAVLPAINATSAPFGQVIQILAGKEMECWKKKYDLALVWTQPHAVIGSFNRILNYQQVPADETDAEVERYVRLLMGLQDRVSCIFVPTWTLPSYYRGYGMLDMKKGLGVEYILNKMNIALSERLSGEKNVYLLDAERWIKNVGGESFNPKMWYLSKTLFDVKVLKEAMQDIKAALSGIMGQARKLIILDLDDTLWGGAIGDLGPENIILGGHDPSGEAFVDFQRTLKSMLNRGILLGIVSKNEERIAMEAINEHPEMVLRAGDFAGWRINWDDKAKNVAELASQLNLGLQSVVFIDDNPAERARIREILPEVLVPEWPEDKMMYNKTLLGLRCFDAPSLSEEDLGRASLYIDEKKRQDLKREIGSVDDWLKTLNIKIKIDELADIDLARTTQLLNKTNQMNLSTRRMTEKELLDWARGKDHKLWVFRVSDRFGDLGLTGIISLEISGNNGRIADFVLSCRVLGRKAEETMIYTVINYARSKRLEKVYAKFVPTSKNKPCLEFLTRSGFDRDEKEDIFTWNTDKTYPLPQAVEIL